MSDVDCPCSSVRADPDQPAVIGVRRRRVLQGLGLGASALALAACGDGGSGAGGGSAAGGSNPAAAASSGSGGPALIAVASVPVGGSASATDDGHPILVAQPTAGKVVAFSAICTHMGCTVPANPAGSTVQCPCHGSQYDAFTGQVLRGPAPRALAPVAVSLQDGQVVAD